MKEKMKYSVNITIHKYPQELEGLIENYQEEIASYLEDKRNIPLRTFFNRDYTQQDIDDRLKDRQTIISHAQKLLGLSELTKQPFSQN